MKAQVVLDQTTGQIICTTFSKGQVHDFRVFKQHRIPMIPEQSCLVNKGYQGLAKLKLDNVEQQFNQMLASLQIVVEHTKSTIKIWRI